MDDDNTNRKRQDTSGDNSEPRSGDQQDSPQKEVLEKRTREEKKSAEGEGSFSSGQQKTEDQSKHKGDPEASDEEPLLPPHKDV
jgi:hypothetical protein